MHREAIIHLYLRPVKILLDDDFNPVIADFGAAESLGNDRIFTVDDKKVDVYAYAMTVWELLSRRRNWFGERLALADIQAKVMRGRRPDIEEALRSSHPDLVAIIEVAWRYSPHQRPTFEDILGL